MEEIEAVDQKTSAVSTSVFSDSKEFQTLFDIGKMFASSSLVPDTYRGKAMDCAIAVDMANRMGVSPMMVMQNLYVVKGKPSWSGQACMSMIQASSKYRDAKPVYVGTRGTDDWGCYIRAFDAETGEEVDGTHITIKMAKAEGWYNKSGSKWLTMPEQMLAYRAAAFFARVYIPNSLMGCSVEGEAEDIENSRKTSAIEDPFRGDKDDFNV